MHKTLIAVVVLAVVGAGLYYLLTMYQPSPDALSELNQEQQMEVPAGEMEAEGVVRGIVVSVDTEKAMVDGPYLITLKQENNEEVVVAVPSMGLPTCAARENITDVYLLAAGQFVEAHGAVGEDGMIIPCESADHYLKVVEVN